MTEVCFVEVMSKLTSRLLTRDFGMASDALALQRAMLRGMKDV
jgi:hypothetical protein